jgi:hypothetical protein
MFLARQPTQMGQFERRRLAGAIGINGKRPREWRKNSPFGLRSLSESGHSPFRAMSDSPPLATG